MGGRELTASLGEAECILDAQQDGAPSLRASRIVPLRGTPSATLAVIKTPQSALASLV